MRSDALTLSRDDREQRPYRSLYAALLFQSFRDAIAEMTSAEKADTWTEANVPGPTEQMFNAEEDAIGEQWAYRG